jgi:zinc transporter 1
MKKVKQKKAPSMNMHGIFLHVLADALGSIVVIISSLIIKFVPHNPNDTKHWTVYVDPTLSLLIVIIITISAIPLLKETTLVLLQAAPKNIEIASLKKRLLDQVPEIDGIHDLHVWRLTSNAIIATAHLHRKSLTDYMTVANKVKRFFHGLDIHSTTIQYEHQNDESQDYLINNNKESDKSRSTKIECLVSCPEDACDTKTCCPKDLIDTDGALSTNNNNSAQNKSTSALNIAVEMTDEQPQNRTTSEDIRIGASNNGFIPEKF